MAIGETWATPKRAAEIAMATHGCISFLSVPRIRPLKRISSRTGAISPTLKNCITGLASKTSE
jgi:hypothetical protein